ncbi:hypothetical protein P6U16_25855 (plasmid) [Rhizobium sp. 32-5/1]|uniref:hypothetical protein n=1 Tax=Rhizobium sp. 32-5/1 TaxID=3019602 RepID=UPI00240E595D|nr:hypothetical protein [Rhizobium sp. 32-5/1]WEZ85495.1 hypothetical protein P6U16_25855 [Rhizobium sp. 32-5/1]
MAERLKLWTGQVAGALTEATRHVSRQIWIYVFAALIWALVWYGMMDVLTLLNSNPSFPFDVMPIVAGIPIIVVGWRAASLGQELQKAIRRFNDAAAFVFPAGQSGTLGAFLDDLSKTVTRWSRLTAAGIFVIAVVGSLIGSAAVEPCSRRLSSSAYR